MANDPISTGLWASLAGAVTALAWALVRRVRQARRIMPRGRFRMMFSLRSPTSDAAPPAPKRGFREPLSLEQPSEPPLDLQTTEPLDEEDPRPTTPPTPKRPRK
jgi:hypothetical protein